MSIGQGRTETLGTLLTTWTADAGTSRATRIAAVLFIATRPLSLSDVEFLDWAPYLEVHEPTARNENHP